MFDSKKLAVRKDIRELDYWRKQLENISPYLDLNTDRPRNSSDTGNLLAEGTEDSATLYTLSPAETIALKQVAQKNKASL